MLVAPALGTRRSKAADLQGASYVKSVMRSRGEGTGQGYSVGAKRDSVAPLADEASFEARSRWRLLEERTRDQSYKIDSVKSSSGELTGELKVDVLLAPYVRPSGMGAA
jgi:hypothetical protein